MVSLTAQFSRIALHILRNFMNKMYLFMLFRNVNEPTQNSFFCHPTKYNFCCLDVVPFGSRKEIWKEALAEWEIRIRDSCQNSGFHSFKKSLDKYEQCNNRKKCIFAYLKNKERIYSGIVSVSFTDIIHFILLAYMPFSTPYWKEMVTIGMNIV